MKFLLLQARNPGDAALEEERLAFVETLPDGAVVHRWDLLQGPPSLEVVDEIDCVLVGGAGEFGVGNAGAHAWLVEFIDFCGVIADRGSPAFFSCFGFQALVMAAGGRVETDMSRAELGTFAITLTDAGRADPIFGPLAPGFHVQCGHKDHATELPQGLITLASSQRSTFQAVAVRDRPVYATQFHPELSMSRNRDRFYNYRAHYSQPDLVDPPDVVLASFRETPEASSLLGRFVNEFLTG